MKLNRLNFACLVLNTLLLVSAVSGQEKRGEEMMADEAGQEENLNRELWESIKKTPYANALRYVEAARQVAVRSAEVALPTGWKLAPAGRQIEVGRLPFEAISYANRIVVLNTGYYSREPQEVSVVNPETGSVVRVLRLNSMFPSAVAGADGDLYISGGFDQKVYRFNPTFDAVREYGVRGYAAGLAAIDADRLAVVYLVANNSANRYDEGKLAILNTKTGQVERETAAGYFPHTVRFSKGKLYVSVLGENKVRVFNTQLEPIKTLAVGRTPQGICGDGNELYVVNTGSDNLSVIDTRTDNVSSTIDLRGRQGRAGSAPVSCAADGKRLYVPLAYRNAVAVYDRSKRKTVGYIPTGWYPTKALVSGGQLLVLSAKGIRSRRPNVEGPQPVPEKGGAQYVLTLLKGSLAVITLPTTASNQAAWTRQVEEGAPIYSPPKSFKSPVRHVFYVVRENRSYDQVLGDLGRGNGDSNLTLFGRDVTPVAHHVAGEFVTLDNYYADGEISVLGHSFTTSGYASPFLEWLGNAAYSGRYVGYPFGMVPAATSPAYLWDTLDDSKIDYRIYGENYFLYTRAYRIIKEKLGADSELGRKFYTQMMSLAQQVDRGNTFYEAFKPFYGQADSRDDAMRLLLNPSFARPFSIFLCGDESLVPHLKENAALRAAFAEYLVHYPFNYRSWSLTYSDLERVQAWKTDFEKQLRAGRVASLHYIWLPNDHTGGTDKRYLSPEQLVAQNDAALGQIIETIARSPVWKQSIILMTEDDAQNGPDHVDATRTVALAVGPYVRRKAVVSDRYDQLSMLRTIELLLGLNPLNENDALAVPMFGILTDKPNVAPYVAPEASKSLTDADRALYRQLKGAAPVNTSK
jgi:YVTN family beta-propeller protein